MNIHNIICLNIFSNIIVFSPILPIPPSQVKNNYYARVGYSGHGIPAADRLIDRRIR